MVIKIEKGEEGIGVVAVRFSSRNEYDEWLQESRRRLKKANQLHINDMDKAQQKYGSKIMDQILEEYLLQQHNPKIAIEVDQL